MTFTGTFYAEMEETLSLEHACYPLSISGWHIIGLISVCIGWLFFLPVYNLSLPMRALVAIVAGTILGWSQFVFHSWLREAFLIKGGTGFDMLSSVMITLSITGMCCIAFCLLRGACLPYLETCYGSKKLWLSNSIPNFNAKWLALFVVIGFISWHFLSFASGISIRLLFMRQMLWMAYALFAGFLCGGIYEMYRISSKYHPLKDLSCYH